MYVGKHEFFACFFVLFQVQELHNVARKEGRQTERMGGKEAENIFSIKVTCRPQKEEKDVHSVCQCGI